MSDDDLFTYYRGRGRMQIVPRSGKGWVSLALYLATVISPTLLMPFLGNRMSISIVAACVVLTLIVTFLWIRWAISRSKRVDLDDLDRNYPDYLEWKRRHRRD